MICMYVPHPAKETRNLISMSKHELAWAELNYEVACCEIDSDIVGGGVRIRAVAGACISVIRCGFVSWDGIKQGTQPWICNRPSGLMRKQILRMCFKSSVYRLWYNLALERTTKAIRSRYGPTDCTCTRPLPRGRTFRTYIMSSANSTRVLECSKWSGIFDCYLPPVSWRGNIYPAYTSGRTSSKSNSSIASKRKGKFISFTLIQ